MHHVLPNAGETGMEVELRRVDLNLVGQDLNDSSDWRSILHGGPNLVGKHE